MAEEQAPVAKTKRRTTVAAALLVLSAGLLAVAVWYTDGMSFLPTVISDLQDLVSSAKPDAAPARPVRSGNRPGRTPTSVEGVTEADRVNMFGQQIGSQEQIRSLVDGEFKSFTFGPVTKGDQEATIRTTGEYTSKSTISGTVKLRKHGTRWFLLNITRDGNEAVLEKGRPINEGVADTIVQQQAASQDVLRGLVDGGYRRLDVDGVVKGADTVTLKVRLSGGSLPEVKGDVVCVTADVDGVEYWFITTFRKV